MTIVYIQNHVLEVLWVFRQAVALLAAADARKTMVTCMIQRQRQKRFGKRGAKDVALKITATGSGRTLTPTNQIGSGTKKSGMQTSPRDKNV